ncbi:MAG: prepilin-type N-terminal cleavage/methylation domain-containing protein [Planctomycetes bacterium]|nr:prepilin-type N-terminal cleavage/methylation domain-containing protein [Planctomycetota bacterium]
MIVERNVARRDRRGFTLVEVLVVLLIMAGMMVAMLQILNAARTSRDTVHNIQETQLAGPAILDLVERDLRAIFVYGRPKEELLRVKNRVVYGLDADSLDFICTTPTLTPVLIGAQDRYVRADYNEVGYCLRPNPADDNFLELYRRESMGVDEEPFEGGAYTFLHDRVKHFDVKLFDEDGPDAEPIETWNTVKGDEHSGLPKRIEITLTLELAPRIMREQIEIAPIDKRSVTYKRTVRFPNYLLDAVKAEVRPKIPVINPPASEDAANANDQQPTAPTDGAAQVSGG